MHNLFSQSMFSGYIYEGNDMPNLSWEKVPALMKYLKNKFSQNLVQRQDEADNALISYVENEITNKDKHYEGEEDPWREKQEFAVQLLKKLMVQTMKLHNLRLKLGFHENCLFHIDPMFKDILIAAKGRAEEWGGQLYFVYLPSNARYGRNICRKRMFHLQREKIIPLVNELNINVIDMT